MVKEKQLSNIFQSDWLLENTEYCKTYNDNNQTE